jgi:hypothetical protein
LFRLAKYSSNTSPSCLPFSSRRPSLCLSRVSFWSCAAHHPFHSSSTSAVLSGGVVCSVGGVVVSCGFVAAGSFSPLFSNGFTKCLLLGCL